MPTRKPKAKTIPQPVDGLYPSSIILGKHYTHSRTGLGGHAISLTFMETSCELVMLEYVDPITRKIAHGSFDAEQCVLTETLEPVTGSGQKGSVTAEIPMRPGLAYQA